MSADLSAPPAASVTSSGSPDFGRAAMAILVAMVVLIVALTGILLETTWSNPTGAIEALPPDPGSFARR